MTGIIGKYSTNFTVRLFITLLLRIFWFSSDLSSACYFYNLYPIIGMYFPAQFLAPLVYDPIPIIPVIPYVIGSMLNFKIRIAYAMF